MIEISNVTKAYGDTVVFDRVSLSLPAGGITAIVGPNGAGKSTLLSIIARLIPMTSGRVTVADLDVSLTPGDTLAKKLAILRQDNHVTPRLTVRELVSFGRYPHSRGRLTFQDDEKIQTALGYTGLEDLEARFLDELSGGQRQRAFLAMVLAQDTDCLLLDEPLNNLDMRHAVNMMKLLRRAANELGKTVILVLHDINFASCYADRIVAMKGGRIAFYDHPNKIMRQDVLRSIYDLDITIHDINGIKTAMYYI